jgi:choline dehydrogenase-like flavoprotein
MSFPDIYSDGIASGWKVVDAAKLDAAQTMQADVAIIGSGAGGGVAAEILSQAGLAVLLIEEGPLKTSADFKDMQEARAYRDLYQGGGPGKATSDGAITILQGRAVGGSTTVNWTSSFRTPEPTLQFWAAEREVRGHSVEDMKPWFEAMEQRLNVAPWAMTPNANNHVLQRGCERLGWESHVIPRNVKGCWDSGYCGFGCPVNAKQSMLVTCIPDALAKGATLVHRLRVRQLQHANGQITAAIGEALSPKDGTTPTGVTVTIRARHFIAAGGALNTPALLLRSQLPDPHELVGKHTLIHPVVLTTAVMPERIEAFYGAPQSIASDHFQWKDGATGPMGYKLEVLSTSTARSRSSARLARLAQGVDALLGQQRDQLQEDLGGDDGVAQRGVAADHGDVEALGNRLQPVGFLVRMHHRRQQQGVEHRLVEAHAGAASLSCRKRMSKAALWATSTVSCAKAWKAGSTCSMVGWPAPSPADAVDRDAGGGIVALRVDQLLEGLLLEQLAVDDARGADLDDLVAFGRVEAGGLGVEHGVGQLGQRRSSRAAALRSARTGRSRSTRAGCRQRTKVRLRGLRLRRGQRQQEAEEGLVRTRSRSNQNSPPWRSPRRARSAAAVGADGHGSISQPSPSRCSSPGRTRSGRGAPGARRRAGAVHAVGSNSSTAGSAR